MFVLVFLFVNALIVAFTLNHDFVPSDVGDTFVKMQKVAEYADQRLQAAATAAELPKPPAILADQYSLRLALLATLLSQVLIFGIVGLGAKQDFTSLMRILKLNEYAWWGVWKPALAVIGAYLGTALYVYIAKQVLPDFLVPQSTVPTEITRDDSTLAIAAVVTILGAPFTEELFFRGFVFSGLLKWGFWPAASLSALLFTLVHFDPGSLVPFFFIGIVMAWLFHSRGSLWDSVLFHFLFNFTSFLVLAATS